MIKDTLILAHYYTPPEVQQMADFVGDSLELSLRARDIKAKRIVLAGVKFMAETAKILNPRAEVVLPDYRSTCSLVTMTDIEKLDAWVNKFCDMDDKPCVHISYINSSVQHKALADIIVTSRNMEDICERYANRGYRILFSPDYNMGMYLKHEHPTWDIEVWDAVCEVHEKFNMEALSSEIAELPNGQSPYLLAHPESTLSVLKNANFIGSTFSLLDHVKNFQKNNHTLFVATEDGILYNMRQVRPDLDIRQAPIYKGCQCNSCPYMKFNNEYSVHDAVNGNGLIIDYIDSKLARLALAPLQRMLEFNNE